MADPIVTTPAPTTPNAGGEVQAAVPVKTFTQEQLDTILADRLSRERAKYLDYDELKKKTQEQDDAKKSEIEKLTERASKAEAKAKEVAEQTTARLVQSEARALAAELGFMKPQQAVKLADLSKAIGEDGEIDSKAVRTSLEALAKESPELLGKITPKVAATNPPKADPPSGKETDEQKRARLYGSGTFAEWSKSGEIVHHGKGETSVSTS